MKGLGLLLFRKPVLFPMMSNHNRRKSQAKNHDKTGETEE
jgi:hypothetical protein